MGSIPTAGNRIAIKLLCQQVKTPIVRRLMIVQTMRVDSMWVKEISAPRVRDTHVIDTAFYVVISMASYRVTLSIWWVMVTFGHDALIPEGSRF